MITLRYCKSTSGVTGNGWENGLKNLFSDISTSFTILSGIDFGYCESNSAINKKLHYFIGPTYSEVLAPAKRLRDVDTEVSGQRQTNAEVKGQRQRSSLKSKLGWKPKLQG